MYQYRIPKNLENIRENIRANIRENRNENRDKEIISLFNPEYIKLNEYGFADLLSCSLETTNDLKWAKDKIERIKEPVWEEIKKATNPYELIYAAPNMAIAKLKPLSRSFFKMVEMINEFASDFINLDVLISLHIAEGPGGFIEATRYIRRQKGHNNDTAFGITLTNKIDNGENIKNIPAWKQSNYFLRNHPEVIISYGVDGTGNIYNPENIIYLDKEIHEHCTHNYSNLELSTANRSNNALKDAFKDAFKDAVSQKIKLKYKKNMFASLEAEIDLEQKHENTCNNNVNAIDCVNIKNIEKDVQIGHALFITADGGFDYSIDYNYQEQASSKLIFSQIITALKCQVDGGIFICKIFDMNLLITIEMIYLMYMLYNDVIIYKPFTSRIANSEKYLICNGFKGVSQLLLDKLLSILADWNKANMNGQTINHLLTDIPDSFIYELKQINKIIVSNQIDVINEIMNIYHHKLNLDNEWKKENYKKQHTNAIDWCKTYNIPYNS
jgi:23S rRNA U2552 (ribose-2'-O)-methylase RlmE/FtsJ